MLEELRQQVCQANRDLVAHGLVTLTFGNASGRDAESNLVAIKPSGVSYEDLKPEHLVIVNIEGDVVEGNLRPSSDTPTHVALYREFPKLGGITHTHSTHATVFAQACRGIPCLGTTHADHFPGAGVPVTRPLTEEEVTGDYEHAIGRSIIEVFEGIDPAKMRAVLVAHHGPFTWGPDPAEAVVNAIALEEVARTALATLRLAPDTPPIPYYLRQKHFLRKHGPDSYYGQKP